MLPGSEYYFEYAVKHYEDRINAELEAKRLVSESQGEKPPLAERVGDWMIRMGTILKERSSAMPEVALKPALDSKGGR